MNPANKAINHENHENKPQLNKNKFNGAGEK